MELDEGWEDVLDEHSTTTSLVGTETDPDILSLVDGTGVTSHSALAAVDAALCAQDSELEAQESQVWALESKLWAKRAELAAEQVANAIAQHSPAPTGEVQSHGVQHPAIPVATDQPMPALLLQLVELELQNQALASQLSALQGCSEDFMDVFAAGVKCKKCCKEFQGSGFRLAIDRYRQHFRDTHQIPKGLDMHECPNCLQSFGDQGIARGAERLFQHRQTCDKHETHDCPKCLKSFEGKGNTTGTERLRNHRQTCRAL